MFLRFCWLLNCTWLSLAVIRSGLSAFPFWPSGELRPEGLLGVPSRLAFNGLLCLVLGCRCNADKGQRSVRERKPGQRGE